MPLIQKLMLYIPIIPLGIIMIILAVGLSIVGLKVVWRFVPRQILKTHNDLTAAMFGAIALAYTVLLAFVVVVSWQNFDKAKEHTELEANRLTDLYRDSGAFAEPAKGEIHTLIKDYVRIVINEEWELLARGEESANAGAALRKIWEFYITFEPKTEKEKIFFSESVAKLNELREARRFRIVESREGIHPVLWFILVIGAITIVVLTFFLGSEEYFVHVAMTSTLAIVITLILLTILSFEFPFTGSVRIGPETFQQIIHF